MTMGLLLAYIDMKLEINSGMVMEDIVSVCMHGMDMLN
jgi:hypothetical protein